MGLRLRMTLAAGALLTVQSVSATETITYTYDAKGRVAKVVRTGTVNNNIQSTYTHDKVDN